MSDQQTSKPLPPLSVAEQAAPRRHQPGRWNQWLITFLRAMAVLWMVQGLLLWQVLLMHRPAPLAAPGFAKAAGLVIFAVLDLIAATGLWLPAAWGGVLWVCLCTAQILTGLAYASGPLNAGVLRLADILLLLAYIGLTYLATRERAGR
ncbi:MAG: hypothetical protein KGQ37_05720 [Hyphomicrobiales bacterium]|nr:hypothetical protein [Hyphomicrobiales bacterium]